MLATGFEHYNLATLRINAMTPLFGLGIFTTNGAAWAHSRAILRPSFTKQNMTPLLTMMERHFQMLLKLVPRDGSVFDVQEIFFKFTMDTATEFLMGGSTHTLDPNRKSDRERQFVDDYMNCCYEAVRQVAFGKLQFLSKTPKGIDAATQRARAYVDRFVDDALSRKEKRKALGQSEDGVEYNFLEELAAQTTNRTLLRDQVLNVLLASRDTTAALLSNMFYELARKPELYARLRREVLSKIDGELPTEAEMGNMTFLKWCLNESLRMYPVVPGNTREAICDTILPVGGGDDGKSPIFVKAGTPVLYNVYAMHRRKDIYGEDADEFNPDRWDGLRPGWGFLPFNGGPRVCLGQNFALTEASYVTVRMLQSFDALSAHDDKPWMEQYSLVLCSRNGVQIAMTPAN
ncbi:cytochrome P450 [Podospora aff. communis PSN243]|uniref:Cytochrome P450 n=1 Tax=Podospora aff. communis PSN243 TaxID=3040156 RepID=A0AAV9FYI7_9PEZI|nr:cytochrome P450 [Podospora aff. communis PSN243]